ncbi:site-specific integrase [Qingrenia yutianensis]|uniref:Site-specific integrase n=1 Tax=Qingrenia yutianensis TaxID=2763676 RepID=A0A926FCS5_9FIRM|nr:site-specific integrase [Qingrenia yutianensis]MBC8596867.1 site-specific integrase [Qingrenia yutianensis]
MPSAVTRKAKNNRRLDKSRITLRKGETQRQDGIYDYRWTSPDGKRHSIYASTLEELRAKEEQITVDAHDGIKTETRMVTVNEMFDLWCDLKRGIKDNTFQNYKYMYNLFIRPNFGKMRITMVKKTDVKRFYNTLADGKILKVSTIDTLHNILHQVFDMALNDNYIRLNPTDNMLKELKKAHNFSVEKRKALTIPEQELFMRFLKDSPQYNHWYPIFAVMLGTGMRVGELTGLRWCDIDFDEDLISVNHTLVFYNHGDNKGCTFSINTPKTEAGNRTIPILPSVKEALQMERKMQQEFDVKCSVSIDGYSDFIFVNRFGATQHQGTLNKAIKRIIRDCNDEVLLKSKEKDPVLLPPFSCHSLRHTFTTRAVESGMNVKVLQEVLGHKDISTTLNIYTDVTRDTKKKEVSTLGNYFENLSI